MPDVEGALARFNQQFARPNIDDVDPTLYDGSHSMADIAAAIGLSPTDDEGSLLTEMPDEIGAALVAFIHANLLRSERRPMILGWEPAYAWNVNFAYGGPCVLMTLRSAYPSDLRLLRGDGPVV